MIDLTLLEGHTKGPWSVAHFAADELPCNCQHVLHPNYMGAIADVHYGGENPPLEEAKANARLIAAAPQLFDIVKKLQTDTGTLEEIREKWDESRFGLIMENSILKDVIKQLKQKLDTKTKPEWRTVTEDMQSAPANFKKVLFCPAGLEDIFVGYKDNDEWISEATFWVVRAGDQWIPLEEIR